MENKILKNNNYINVKKFKVTKFSIIILVFVFSYITLSFYSISLYSKNIYKKYQNYFSSVEHSVNETIINMQYLMTGLSQILAKYEISGDMDHIRNLVLSFNPKEQNDINLSSLTVDLILLDAQSNIIMNTSIDQFNLVPKFKEKFQKCFDEANNQMFKLNVLPIRSAERNYKTAEFIIPLNMSFHDSAGKRQGILCSGIKLQNFNHKLNILHGNQEGALSIQLINLNEINRIQQTYLEELQHINVLLKALIKGGDLVISKKLERYPFYLSVKISSEELVSDIKSNIVYYFSYLIITLFFAFLCLRNFKQSIQEPIFQAHRKLHLLVKALGKAPISAIRSPENFLLQKFDPEQFCIDVDQLINHCSSLDLDQCNHLLKNSTDEIKNKVLAALVKEEKFLPFIKTQPEDQERLYFAQLLHLIDEKEQKCDLEDFLNFTQAYCIDFYPDIQKIELITFNAQHSEFSCKKNMLLETIFLVVTFLMKDKCNLEDSKITFIGNMPEDSQLPVISIEMTNYIGMASALNWYSGPAYVYAGILPIIILAIKNNYFLKIDSSQSKIMVVLEPIHK